MSKNEIGKLSELVNLLNSNSELKLRTLTCELIQAVRDGESQAKVLSKLESACEWIVVKPSVLRWLANNHVHIMQMAGASNRQIADATSILSSYGLAIGSPSGENADPRIALSPLDISIIVLAAMLLAMILVFMVIGILNWVEGNKRHWRIHKRPIWCGSLPNGARSAGLDEKFRASQSLDPDIPKYMFPLLTRLPSASVAG